MTEKIEWADHKYVFALMTGLGVAFLLLWIGKLIGDGHMLAICVWAISVATTFAVDNRLNR